MKATYRVKRYKSAARPTLKALVVWKDDEAKRQRKFFDSVKEAETFAQQRNIELLNQGSEALSFSSSLRVMAQECQAQLSKRGRTLRDATEHFLAYLDAASKSAPVEMAVAEFLAGKERREVPLHPRYLARIKSLLSRFHRALPGKLVCHVSVKDCEDWLASVRAGAVSYNSYILLLREFFKWCAKPQRKYCKENVAFEIEFEKEVEKPVGILTPDQLTALLEAASPGMLAYVAIGAFAGLRSAELQRLDWSEVDLEDGFIEVTAAKAKSARRRLVKIQPALRAWIEPLAKSSGKVTPINIDFRLAQLHRRAGIEHWPKNALRHSFASYHLAQFKDAAALALEMGHRRTDLIFQHYRKVVRESQAIAYWNIVPAQPENVLLFARRNAEVLPSAQQEREHGSGRFKPSVFRGEYQQPVKHYTALFKVGRKVIQKWMALGKPLDDPAAMERLKRGEYQQTDRQYAAIYETTVEHVRLWRRAGWPLDNVDRTKAYLASRMERPKRTFCKPAGRCVRVIPLSPKDAREAGERATRRELAG